MCALLLSLLSGFLSAWWGSVGLGIGIGLLYNAASLVANWYAMRQNQRVFLLIVVGGMVVLMTIALALVALVVVLVPVQQTAFFASFLGVFVMGMIVEVLRLHRKALAADDL